MLKFNEIKDIFIERLGNPYNEDRLNEYINFCIDNCSTEDETNYCELHHILPRSVFVDYIKDVNNISKLIYSKHVNAHILLSEAYPIYSFIMPLNFMIVDETENSILRSDAVKDWWKFHKLHHPEVIKSIQDKRKNSTNDFEMFKKAGEICRQKRSDRLKNDIEYRDRFCETMSGIWTNEVREKHSKKQNERFSKQSERDKISDGVKKRYLNDEFKKSFDITMTNVNKSAEKRKDASVKLKALWQDPEYVNRVMDGRRNRKLMDEQNNETNKNKNR